MVKERFTLKFPPESSTKPLTYHLIKDFDLKVNILKAEITAGKEGHLLVEVEGDKNRLQEGLDFLRKENLKVIPINKQVKIRHEDCVYCGTCTAVCFSGALSIDRESWKVVFSPDECVVCELCVDACPLRIISIDFGA